MTEALTITTERVDDIPVLAANMEKMGVTALLDEHFLAHRAGIGEGSAWAECVAAGWYIFSRKLTIG